MAISGSGRTGDVRACVRTRVCACVRVRAGITRHLHSHEVHGALIPIVCVAKPTCRGMDGSTCALGKSLLLPSY